MKNKYQFLGNERITATLLENDMLWIAFYGIGGICKLYGCSAYDLDVVYYDLNINANEITSIIEVSNYLYLSLDDTTNICAEFNLGNPTDIWYLTKDSGIIEKAIDVAFDSSILNQAYFLTPGIISGENAKISVYDYNDSFVENIDLTTIYNASKISVDTDGLLWVLSDVDTSSPIITKVEQVSGAWAVTSYTLS